ncbi:MAG: PulJ/GspJ family protein [Actinomycetota bacterium]
MRPTTLLTEKGEDGFTLVELAIAMTLLTIVMTVLMSTLWSVQRSEMYTRGRTAALDDMRAAVNRMTKDLRQTSDTVGTPAPSSLTVETYVDGTAATVEYEVSGETLIRRVNGGVSTPLISGLTTSDIFSYTPDAVTPNMVAIVLSVQPANLPETTLTLDAEIEFRNR